MIIVPTRACLSIVLSLALSIPSFSFQQDEPQPPASEVTPDPWPKTVDQGGTKYTIYQPQVDSWDGYNFKAHAAVSVLAGGSQDPAFGAIELSAITTTDKVARTVEFYNIQITKSTFPSAPSQAAAYGQALQTMAQNGPSTMSLDRLQASLSILGFEKTARSVPVKNEPPAFVFSTTSAILILIDGEPSWVPVQGTPFQRILNTRALIAKDSSGSIFLHVLNGFVTAQSLSGPWAIASNVPPALATLAQDLSQKHIIDLLDGPPNDKDPSKIPTLQEGVPRLVIATRPTELVITQGAMDWAVLEGTNLLYVKNTTGNIFKDLSNQQNYLLVTGRWFTAPAFSGPWQFISGKSLPPDFANIPDDSPKENVKASVPGTAQAREAVISNEVPHTATVDRAKVQFRRARHRLARHPTHRRHFSQLRLQFARPHHRVSPTQWYALQNGVWFNSTSALGPWAVASSVPPSIYSIPPSSSLYYATYVKIYDSTPTYVVIGYTSGYMGTVVSVDGTVVYGTGYTYVPYVSSSVWYAPPVTYGYAANVTYTPWTGWAVGFGMGMAFGAAAMYSSWGWCCRPLLGRHGVCPIRRLRVRLPRWRRRLGRRRLGRHIRQRLSLTGALPAPSPAPRVATMPGPATPGAARSATPTTPSPAASLSASAAPLRNVYTGNYAYGGRGATYNPTTGTAAAGSRYTVGNASGGADHRRPWSRQRSGGRHNPRRPGRQQLLRRPRRQRLQRHRQRLPEVR